MPGAAGITLGSTRASAAHPSGHPSGSAIDHLAVSDAALGPDGAWMALENRGSVTANHVDHVHVNYLG